MRSTTTYRNFDLLITRAGEHYRAFVIDAPGGDASGAFELPFLADDLPNLVQTAETRRNLGSEETASKADEPADLRDLGSRLYAALFHGEIHSVFVASQQQTENADQALRIRLRFSDDAATLATLPWETLFDPEQQRFLALSELRPILRYLSLPRSRPALLVSPPLTVLAVLASPDGYVQLDIEREWAVIEQAMAPLVDEGKVKLERLEQPTLETLRQRLLGNEVHIVHFVGHGMYAPEHGEGFLLLEDEHGLGHEVPAQSLALLFHGHTSLRLVYLNACEGAIADHGNVFTGIAQTLVQQGVPAAVAMQDEITDMAAIEMASAFYGALATGLPVDAALTQARVALAASSNDEWVIPVLFSRSPDNRLFDIVDVLPTPDCPYPGMRPFNEAQAAYFYGREREIDEAVDRLAQHPFLTVVGPSGSGKSSLIYAGVIPALRQSPHFGDGEWDVRIMRPSDRRTPEGQADALQALTDTLGLSTKTLEPPNFERPTLLFIDQFEETFTLAGEKSARVFLETLQKLIGQPNLYLLLTVRADFYPDLMVTGDFWKSIRGNRLELTPLGDDELWTALVEPAAKVGVTVDDALAVALISDAAGESGVLPLVQQTLVLLWARVERRQLKLDAYRQMADGHRSGLQVAIDRWADNVYNNQLSSTARPIARRIFMRLIQFGQGRADTRRQQTVEELSSNDDDPQLLAETLAILTQSRLLTTSGELDDTNDIDEVDGIERRVDISHEALITGWGTLRSWIEAQREAETTRRRLEDKAADWERLGRGNGGLLDEFELYEAEEWLSNAANSDLGSSKDLTDLLHASSRAIDERRREEEATRQRELDQERQLAEAQRKRAEEQEAAADSLRKRLVVLVVLGVVAVLLMISAVFFGLQSTRNATRAEDNLAVANRAQASAVAEAGRAERQAMLAETSEADAVMAKATAVAEATRAYSNELDAEAKAELAEENARRFQSSDLIAGAQVLLAQEVVDPSLALLLAIEAANRTLEQDGYVGPYADWNLQRVLADAQRTGWRKTLPHRRHADDVMSASFSPDGKSILTASEDQTVRLWDVKTGRQLLLILGHDGPVWDAEFSPDGQRIATTGQDGTLRLWDPETGKPLCTWRDPETDEWSCQVQAHGDRVRGLAFSPDGLAIITAGQDGLARVWSVETGEQQLEFTHDDGWILSVSYSPDGSRIATTGADSTARIWDAINGDPLAVLPHDKWVRSASFSADNQRLVTANADGTVRVWDVTSGDELAPFSPHIFGEGIRAEEVNGVAHSADGRYAATVAVAGQVLLRDAETGEVFTPLLGHGRTVLSADFSPDSRLLVTAGTDNTVRVWDVKTAQEVLTIGGHIDGLEALTFNADGSQLVTAGEDAVALVWDVETGLLIRAMKAHTDTIRSLTFSVDNTLLATTSEDTTTKIWDIASGEVIHSLEAYTDTVMSAAFSPDDEQIVTVGKPSRIDIWDVASGQRIDALVGHTDTVRSAIYSLDGSTILTASDDGTARLWDSQSGQEVRRFAGHTDGVLAAMFSPNGRNMVTGGRDDRAILWELGSGDVIQSFEGHTSDVTSVDFSADGGTLLTASDDQSARLWRITTGQELRRMEGHSGQVREAIFGPDGSTIATASADATARLWNFGATLNQRDFTGHTGILRYAAFSPDDSLIVTAGEDRHPRLWDVASGKQLQRFTGHEHSVWTAQFHPNGDTILTGSQDGTIRLWDALSGRTTITATVGNEDVNYAGFNPDGSLIVTAGDDSLARIWDTQRLTVTQTLTGHSGHVLDATFSPDSSRVATASADHSARLWDVATGAQIRTFDGHGDWIWYVDFDPRGQRLVTAGGDGKARVWNVATGDEELVLRGHTGLIRSAQFSPDGLTIVTAGEDKTARLWDAVTGRELRQLTGHTAEVWYAGFSNDGTSIITASFDKSARLWDANIEDSVTLAEALIQRDPPMFTTRERERYGIDQ